MIGICGDNCCLCPRYAATINGNPEALEKVKELWVRLGLRDTNSPARDLVCYGCKPENKCVYPELRACGQAKLLANCGLCREYPCALINAAFEKSKDLHLRARGICTPDEIAILDEALFSKKKNLDRMNDMLG